MLGAYAYLGPKATRAIFQLPSEKADILIGAVTVVTGVFGTITGGEHLCSCRHHLRVDVPYFLWTRSRTYPRVALVCAKYHLALRRWRKITEMYNFAFYHALNVRSR